MGTPIFTVPVLEALIQEEDVIAIYTQPDRPKGRGQKILPPPAKELAIKQGIPCFQPASLKSDETFRHFQTLKPDLTVVAAYGLFLPKRYLSVAHHQTINIHPSLLPKYRGAAPIQWALMNGDHETGVSIVYVTPKMDAGDILVQERLPIDQEEPANALGERLSHLGAKSLMKAIALIKQGSPSPVPQDDARVILAPKLTKEMGNIDWSKTAASIHNLIRGANPWPGTYTYFEGELLKIHAARVQDTQLKGKPGKVHAASKDELLIETGKGLLSLTEIQKPNKRKMSVSDFLKGYSVPVGSFLSGNR